MRRLRGSRLVPRHGRGAPFELAPGLFENAAGRRLVREVYADQAPAGYALAGSHERVTKAEYEAGAAHVPDMATDAGEHLMRPGAGEPMMRPGAGERLMRPGAGDGEG